VGGRQTIGRRGFLIGSGATLLLAACSSGDDGGSSSSAAATTTTLHPARLSSDPFQLGVASGDPAADSVVLWTRLAPRPLADDGAAGMAADPVDVRWELATDDRFTSVVADGVATATPDEGHSLHVIADGLDPASEYHYRFVVGDFTSPVGRTRTLPAEGEAVDRFKLAVANCQWYDAGSYAAYRHMAEDDVSLVLHLGDYIYEYAAGIGRRHSAPDREVETLPDYRLRYASYKVDADLQAAHAAFPFVATWDDHEVANNYMGDTVPGGRVANHRLPERRAAAYQAWWENLPTRLPAPEDGHADIYRDVVVGNLARITMLDERQYADEPPCRDGQGIEDDFGDCAERREDRTRLGEAQESFLATSMTRADTTWSLVGNPVVLAGVDAGTTEPEYYLDTWDGYPDAQRRMIASLGAAQNPIVLTGDYHAGMVLDVDDRPFERDAETVCTEFMAPPISSPLFSDDVSARTPQLRQQINAHGYLAVTAEPDGVTAEFKVLRDVTDPNSRIHTEATWVVRPGHPRARVVEV
jgi:alkaline phosphatase D